MLDQCTMNRNSHVAPEPVEVIVGVLALNAAVEGLRAELYSLENTNTQQILSNLQFKSHILCLTVFFSFFMAAQRSWNKAFGNNFYEAHIS